MLGSMTKICPVFNTNRMVAEYFQRFYLPSYRRYSLLSREDFAGARLLAEWKSRMQAAWPDITIESVESPPEDEPLSVGSELVVTAGIRAPGVEPDHLAVEVQFSRAGEKAGDSGGDTHVSRLSFDHRDGDLLTYKGGMECVISGRLGFTVRILPTHPRFGTMLEPGLVCWWE